MEGGSVVVERVGGKPTVTRCFPKYPLKIFIPNKWVPLKQMLSGFTPSPMEEASSLVRITVGEGCTAVLTTRSSTKVYKCIGSKCSEQKMEETYFCQVLEHVFRVWLCIECFFSGLLVIVTHVSYNNELEASIGKDSLLAVIPDPVTCFSTAKYSQLQIFKVVPESSLFLVDWITSGRQWAFSFYKSTNRILAKGDEPVFLDTVLLQQGSQVSISDHLQDYQSIAVIVLLGPKLKHVQHQIQEDVKKLMSEQLHIPSIRSGGDKCFPKPRSIASCSVFGPKGTGVVIRVASMTAESIYNFLQHELAAMKPLLGVSPYF